MRKHINFFELLFKPFTDFFYDLRHKDIRFKQQRNILTMTGETLLPYEIMKQGDEFYLKDTSLDKVEKQLIKVNLALTKQFAAIQDDELIRVIRIK
jgi:hypothetical protein